jgi:opacity protein-like surface antigen
MFKKQLVSAVIAATLMAAPAIAQDRDPFNGFYIGAEAGYENGAAGFDQAIYGGVAGYNFKLANNFFVGVEGEFTGTSSRFINYSYGGTGNIGYVVRKDVAVFARAGYRQFALPGIGDGGDYTLGVGMQFALTENISVRPIVETTAFDLLTLRGGLVWSF